MKNKRGLFIMTAVTGGLFFFLFFISPYDGTILLSEMILQLSGSRGNLALGFSFAELVLFAMKMLPMLIFELIAGIMLYQHFCTASIYVFTRYPYRVKWYIREACRLLSAVCVFYIFFVATVFTMTAIRYELLIDSAGMILAVYHILIHILWIYCMALSVNLTALYLGSSTAYALVAGIQLACIVMLNFADLIVRQLMDSVSYKKILIWNPIAHLVLGWHSSKIETVNQILVSPYLQTDMDNSLILYTLLGVFLTFLGAIITREHDFLISDSEAGKA